MLVMAIAALAWGLLALSGAGCLYLAGSVWAVRRLIRQDVATVPPRPVSVLKPLCGEDADLAGNLRSFASQNHPHYQVVFGVREADDPAVAVVRRLMAEMPDKDLVLVVDATRLARNLKVANLMNMLPRARHDILVLADSDMRVGPDFLATVSASLADPNVGLVTCLYRGVSAGGLWSRLACLYVNHGFLPQAALAEAIGAGAGCFGAAIALRRQTLEAIGGFAAIADALADDYALGAAVRAGGGRLVVSPTLVDNFIAEPSLGAIFRHELRWARTIRLIAPMGFLGSVVTQPVVLTLVAMATGTLPAAAAAMVVLAGLCRVGAVRAVDRLLGLPPSPLHLLPLRDLLSFAVFVASFFARRVAWRDRTFRIGANGELMVDGDTAA